MEILIRKTKKILKTIGLTFLVVILMLVGFHIWFIYNSEKTIERLIAWRSNGQLRAKIKKFSIDYFNNSAQIKEFSIFNTDTLRQGTSYRFTTQQLHFNIRSKWDLVFHKKLLVDSVIFSSPDIIITRRGRRDSTAKKLPLAEELGNIYKAINNSLTVLNLEKFEIREGKLAVRDAGINSGTKFELAHIFLGIDHLKIDSSNANSKHKFAFSDRVLLRVGRQIIKLPDNKSSIGFNELLIDSKLGIIKFLNPIIDIVPLAGIKNSFKAAASQLDITGLDFNTLYVQPVVNIDSVFMLNPQGDLQFYGKNKRVDNKKKILLDDALRHLSVAVNINHVVVENGTVAVKLHQGNKVTRFSTKNDDLSIFGISLNDTATKVLNIKGFNYTTRNYVGYSSDSIYRYRFDSLQFIDNRIILFNLNISTLKKVQSILIRNYNVPIFEITDMDWQSFIFSNHFKARKAVLIKPVFNIEKNTSFYVKDKNGSDKKSIYQALSILSNLFDLQQLKVVNGTFNAKLDEDLNLYVGNLNWEINADELTAAKTFNALIHSVKELSFDTAVAKNADLTLHVSKSNFNNRDKRLLFKNVIFNTNSKSINASLKNVAVNNFTVVNKQLEVNGIHWGEGNITINGRNLNADKLSPNNKKKYSFLLKNISGDNSKLFFENENISAKIKFNTLTAISLSKMADLPVRLNGFYSTGENLIVNLPDGQLKCESMIIKDENISTLKNVVFQRKLVNDTLIFELPFASFTPYINKTLATNTLILDSAELQNPTLFVSSFRLVQKDSSAININSWPAFNITALKMNDAVAHIAFGDKHNFSIIDCKPTSLNVKQVVTQNDKSILLNKITFLGEDILFKNGGVDYSLNGNIKLDANKILFNPYSKNWAIELDRLEAGHFNYAIERNVDNTVALLINKLDVQHLNVTNSNLKDGLPWLMNKSNVFVSFGFIDWQNANTNLKLDKFSFDATKKKIRIDSVTLEPKTSKEDFVSKLIYRKAYTTASSGKIEIDGLYYEEELVHIPHIAVNNLLLDVYSDNLLKAKEQKIKPLPTEAIKRIPFPLQIDTLRLNNMAVNYAEINAITKKTGGVFFNRINGNLFNINANPTETTDSLRLNVTANFLDSFALHLALQASYTDTLNGFALQLNVGKGNARVLNPVLEPFIRLRARAGYVDTMRMNVIANEYSAHGNMQLYYHGLNAELLDSSTGPRPRFKTRMFSFLANSFAIRNKNEKRTTEFYFDRNREKSTVNYLLKMIVQGAAGNVMPQASKFLFKKQQKKQSKSRK